eukprot:TCONS_00053628-protein
MDAFEYQSDSQGKICVTATSGVALASGLYHYLKYYCNIHVSWSGNQLDLASKLPVVEQKVKKTSSDRFRYYQNVCTVSYSSAFWDWARWEKEIDWMALQGINLPLAFTGQEAIWEMVYKEMGLTEPELAEHFSGAAFFAWQRMGNLDGWGGPLPTAWNQKQLALQQLILKRMRSFGMTPVLPGFAGHVPKALVFRLFPQAKYTNSSVWNGFGDQYRTALLDPLDPLFKKVGVAFIQKQIEIYDSTDHVYNGDVFNEMSPPSSDPKYVSGISAAIYDTMKTADPNAIWLMQAWQFLSGFWKDDLIQAWLTAVPLGRLVLLDLASEILPIYKRTKGYFGHPFLWCMLENYGGNTRLYGSSQDVIDGIQSTRINYADQMVGIGSTPEGIDQNPINFELLYEMTYRGNEKIDRYDWMHNYIKRRYNDKKGVSLAAWDLLWKEVYDAHGVSSGGSPQGRVTNQKPYLTTKWPTMLWYNPQDVHEALKKLVDAAETLPMTDALRHDLAKIASTFIEDLLPGTYAMFIDAYQKRNYIEMVSNSNALIEGLKDMDQVLAADRYSLLGNWIESAKKYGADVAEKKNLEFNARNQITLWGPNGQIEDYANKNWAGLISSYYMQRWASFTKYLLECYASKKPYDDKIFKERLMDFEKLWNEENQAFPVKPEGDILQISQTILAKYNHIYQSNIHVFNRDWALGRQRGAHLAEIGYLGAIEERKKLREIRKKRRARKMKHDL